MKHFFVITSLTILMVLEIIVGVWGIFFPIFPLGLIYFSKQYDLITNLVIALVGAIVFNALVSPIFPLITFVNYLLVVLLYYKQTKTHYKDIVVPSFIGSIVFFIFNILYYLINIIFSNDFRNILSIFFSIILLSLILGFISMAAMITILDKLAKKFKLSKFLEQDNLTQDYQFIKRV